MKIFSASCPFELQICQSVHSSGGTTEQSVSMHTVSMLAHRVLPMIEVRAAYRQ